jgi:hypothetical protein
VTKWTPEPARRPLFTWPLVWAAVIARECACTGAEADPFADHG